MKIVKPSGDPGEGFIVEPKMISNQLTRNIKYTLISINELKMDLVKTFKNGRITSQMFFKLKSLKMGNLGQKSII